MQVNEEEFTHWLQRTYVMEKDIHNLFSSHQNELEELPQLQSQIKNHLANSKVRLDRIGDCLSKYDQEPSATKNKVSQTFGTFQGFTDTLGSSNYLRHFISDYSFISYQVAMYHALISFANSIGDQDCSQMLNKTLEEANQINHWFQDHLSSLPQKLLNPVLIPEQSNPLTT